MTPHQLRLWLSEECGWCGCGAPWDAFNFFRELLRNMSVRQASATQAQWSESNDRQDNLCEHNTGIEYFVLYAIDRLGIIEHGGSVGGSWLTGSGYEVLEAMNAISNVDEFFNNDEYMDCGPEIERWKPST